MLRVRQVKVEVSKNPDIEASILKKLHIKKEELLSFNIKKESIDARCKDKIEFVYEVDVNLVNEDKILKRKDKDVFISKCDPYIFKKTGKEKYKNRPIIVGMGPAGLFAGYILAEAGYAPILIDRGTDIDTRTKKVNDFFDKGILDINSNVQFGEGGAGTFSDGKLNTLVKDKENRISKVFETFILNGAPREILYKHNAHIGTDLLREVMKNMRNKMISMGAEFLYNTKLTDIKVANNKITHIEVNNNKLIPCDICILAIGHSARDTYKLLFDKKIAMEPKSFAVGLRISHPQELIDNVQYGKYKDILGVASYKLTYTTKKNRAVYSFCMCPGGYVVNASSEEEHLVINGMSNHARDSKVANSAIVVGINPSDYGNSVFGGIKYQKDLEKKAYELGDGKIPIQRLEDFMNDKNGEVKEFKGCFKGDVKASNVNEILPDIIKDSIKEAIPYFGSKIKGFDNPNTLLAAIETRTSSPIRLNRNLDMESNIKGIYPVGEGAGYSGGITTSAIDGIKVAEVIGRTYDTKC